MNASQQFRLIFPKMCPNEHTKQLQLEVNGHLGASKQL